jgi:hypothetical protein
MIGPLYCSYRRSNIYSIEDSHDRPLYIVSVGDLLYIDYRGLS